MPLLERVAAAIAAMACSFLVVTAGWGIAGKIGAGHYAAMASEGIMADNMFRWRMAAPVWSYLPEHPTPADWYCNHPWGLFWITAGLYKLFGHQDFILPLPAVLMSGLTGVLIYGMARDAWGRAAGAAAVCGYALLPITQGFANFHSLEVMVMAGWCLFFWGLLKMLRSGSVGHLAASLAGAWIATFADWPAYLAIAVMLALCLPRLWLLPSRWFEPYPGRRYAQWWSLTTLLSIGALALWVILFWRAGRLGDWIGSAEVRGGAREVSLAEALAARRPWIDMAFTPMVVWLGKLALPVVVVRALWLRREAEVVSLAVWVAAVIQYVVFKRGADVHFFWPQYFALYYALALAQLVATLQTVLQRLTIKHAGAIVLCSGLLPSALILPDALWALRYARETGGRFNERGLFIRTDQDLVEAASWIREKLPPDGWLEYPEKSGFGWHAAWQLRSPSRSIPGFQSNSSADEAPLWLSRSSVLDDAALRTLAAQSHVQVIGDLWLIDRRKAPAPLTGYSFNERDPGLLERSLYSGVMPVLRIESDVWTEAEWRMHLDQPVQVIAAAPVTLAQLRVAHNLAEEPARASLRERITSQLDPSAQPLENDDVKLIGVRRIEGVHPRIELWMESRGPSRSPMMVAVEAAVEASARWSLMPADPTLRDGAPPPSIPTSMWRRGLLYAVQFPVMHRRGRERFTACWRAANTRPAHDGVCPSASALVAVVE